jgi:hypothetical protein
MARNTKQLRQRFEQLRREACAYEVVCPYCGAKPRNRCSTAGGAFASRVHQARIHAAERHTDPDVTPQRQE